MPSSLDEDQRAVIIRVISVTNIVLMGACYNAQRLVNATTTSSQVTKKVSTRKSSANIISSNPTVKILWGCFLSMCLMVAASAVLTALILWLGGSDNDDSTSSDSSDNNPTQILSSSINFCEADFVDHPSIAEPANTASSVASYIPLGMLGLWGPPAQVWRNYHRFAISYITLLGIGIGSALLHATLTAVMQGGDELPMLWFIASMSSITLDVVLTGMKQQNKTTATKTETSSSKATTTTTNRRDAQLQWFFGVSALVATLLYLFWRENFLPFLIMFMTYAWITLIGLIMICFVIHWNDDNAARFKSNILLPLGVCTALHAIIGITAWGSEMVFCNAVISSQQQQQRSIQHSTDMLETAARTLLPFFFNRGVHLLWHCSSALLAWMGIQTLIAAKGVQLGWGDAQIQWWGAPYVSFQKKPKTV